MDALTELFAQAQQSLFESLVQPLVVALGLSNLLEMAYEGTGWLLVGWLQIAVMLVLIGPLERLWPAAPVHDAEDVFQDPQLVARDLLWQAPTDGTAPRRMYGHPVKFDADMPRLRTTAPALGADTEAVLKEAGYDAEAIRNLRASGAL